MTLQLGSSSVDPAADSIPVVVGIALDHGKRRRLAALLDGVGVLMFMPDLVTAHTVLARQLTSSGAGAVPDEKPPIVRLGGLEVDGVRRRASWQERPLPLTQREQDLLACLAADLARVWTYRELYVVAWTGRYLDPGPVRAAIKRLRRKLRQAGVAVRIDAVRGIGYQLVGADG